MKSFEKESKTPAAESAALILEIVPLIMRIIRREVRRRCPSGLSLPQFRALVFLRLHPGASLNELAEFLGLSASTSSKIIDLLMKRELVCRQTDAHDRRRAVLALSDTGEVMAAQVSREVQAHLTTHLQRVPEMHAQAMIDMLSALHAIFQYDLTRAESSITEE